MFCGGANAGDLRRTCPRAGPTGPTGPSGPTGATGPASTVTGPTGPAGDNIILVRSVNVSYTGLASTGLVTLYTASSVTASYSVIGAYLVANGSTQFSGGDRSVRIWDGTHTFGTIPASTLQSAAASSYSFITQADYNLGNFGIILPSTDPLAVSTPGFSIYAQYTGGSTDYTAGNGLIDLILFQVSQ